MANKPMDRRKFLQETALYFGAGSWVASHPLASPTAAPARIALQADSSPGDLQMRASFSPTETVWIIRQPNSGFQQMFASRELARGLRNLGLVREPVEAIRGSATPAASRILKLTKLLTRLILKSRCEGPDHKPCSMPFLIFSSVRAPSLVWMVKSIPWSIQKG